MRKTVSFYGTCGARDVLTLVSQPITHPFVTRRVRVKFADGCVNVVKVEVLIAADAEAPASGRPNGTSLLDDYGQVRYVVGNSEVVVLEHEVEVPHGNSYIKVYADNRDYYAHDVLVQVMIDSMERR